MADVRGGAIYLYGATSSETTIRITKSLFAYNTADDGGAIVVLYATLHIADSNFMSNRANQDGGSIFITDRSSLAAEKSVFTNNSCRRDGGAIKIEMSSNTDMISNKFVDNTAGSGGGAVMVLDGSVVRDSVNLYSQNTAQGFGNHISNLTLRLIGILHANLSVYIAVYFCIIMSQENHKSGYFRARLVI